MNTKRMIAVVAVLAMAFAALAFVPAEENSAADEKEIVYFEGGELSSTLTGTSTQKVIIQKDLTVKAGGQILIEGDLEIPAGVTVTIEDGTAVQGKGIFTIYGNAVIDGTITSKVADGLYIEPGVGATSSDHTVTVNGTINASGNAIGTYVKTVTLKAVFPDYSLPTPTTSQSIIVNGAVNVGSNAGAELKRVIFADKSTLSVLGTAWGDVRSAGLTIVDGSTTNPEDTTSFLSIFIAEKTAEIDIAEVIGGLIVSDIEMFAYAYGGTQYYAGAVPEYAPAGTGLADVAIAEFVTGGADKAVEGNFITFINVMNVKVTEKINTFMAYDEDISDDWMCAATEMIVSPLDSTKAVEGIDKDAKITTGITLNKKGETLYFETMTIEDVAVNFSENTSKVIIRGDVTYPLQDNSADAGNGKFVITSNCIDALEITGSLAILKKTSTYALDGSVIAAHYKLKDADNNYDHYYTTLSKAVAADAKDITMLGQLIVKEDIKVPAGTKLTTAANLAQGNDKSAVIIEDGATLTIVDQAELELKGDVNVKGTFVIENTNYGIKFNGKNIYADVLKKSGANWMYTNIYIAFGQAKAGDEINAYNPKSGIVIDKDLILPAGVTFSNKWDASQEYAVTVKAGVTFTIAGKLFISCEDQLSPGGNGWNIKTPAVDPNSKVVKDYSVLVIGANGMIVIKELMGGVYTGHKIAGAYFEKDGDHYITNIAYAFENILDAKLNTVDIAKENTIENLKVAGTETERIIVNFLPGSKVTMKNFTFAYGEIKAEAGATLTGDIGTATGKMILDEATVLTDTTLIFREVFVNDAMNLEVEGAIKSDKATEISGIVYLKKFFYYVATTSGAEYELLTYAEKRFVVPAGTAVFFDGGYFDDVELLIEGEFTVVKGATLSAGPTSYVSVLGTLAVPKIDGVDAMASIVNLIVGGSTDSFNAIQPAIGGNALVAGDGKFSIVKAYVFNGAKVTADVLAKWMDDTKNTEFNVDGALWMTAYATDNVVFAKTTDGKTEYFLTPAVENMEFNGWQTYDEKTKTYKAVEGVKPMDNIKYTFVGDAGYTKVYADIIKNIYKIHVVADAGIDNVYMDGILMTDYGTYRYAEVAAGTHTLEYTLANGYSGSAVITTIDGKALVGGGLSFIVNDDKYDATAGEMVITLSGIQKSGIDIDPDTHKETSTGLSVTEILLIVVVIIMAVMAVVLILRLNRS